jgi:hypothetical protein
VKFNCGPSPEAKAVARAREFERLQEWHAFYAIWPRRVGENDCRMLEWIVRRGGLTRLTYVQASVSCTGGPGAGNTERWR